MSRPIRVFTPGSSAPVAARGAAPIVGLVAALAAAAVSPAVLAQCNYEITATIQGPECGIFGFPPTFGTALSDNGEVVGWYTACTIGTDEAFYWSEKTGFVTLDRPPGVYAAYAAGLTSDGTIVGTYAVEGIGFRGFTYKDGEWTELPPVNPASGWSSGSAIRLDGQMVVGDRSITDDPSPYNACIWDTATGKATDLGILHGPFSSAVDVTQSGMIVGWTGNHTQSVSEGFVLVDDVFTFLGPVPSGTTSTPRGVTEGGIVFGTGRVPIPEVPSGATRAFMWQSGRFQMLGTLPGYLRSRANDATDDPLRLVGECWSQADNDSIDTGFLWQDGQMFDLNNLIRSKEGAAVSNATAVRGDGVILVVGEWQGDLVGMILSPQEQPGDLNGDCQVNAHDLLSLLSAWGACASCTADLNADGLVGPHDLAMLLANWG